MTIKSAVVALSFLLSQIAFAQDFTLTCTGKHNLDVMMETEVTLSTGEKNKLIGEFERFQIFLSSMGNDVVELHALNVIEPSRSYATAKLTEAGSFVDLSVWTREFIFEVRCTR